MGLSFFYIAFIIIFIIGVGSQFFTKEARVKRKLKKSSLKSILAFKDGDTAKIVGHVEIAEEALIAPISGRKCAAYYVLVERKSSSDDNRWETMIEEEDRCPYVIKEGNSYAYISGDNSNTYIVQDKQYDSGFLNDATDELEKYLNKHDCKSENFLGMNKLIRYKEGVLEEGEKIAAFGKGKWKHANLLNLPEKYKKVLELSAVEGSSVYLSDDPNTTKESL